MLRPLEVQITVRNVSNALMKYTLQFSAVSLTTLLHHVGERLLRLTVVLVLRLPHRIIMLLLLKEKKKLNMDKMESMEDFVFILTMDSVRVRMIWSILLSDGRLTADPRHSQRGAGR